MTRADTSLEFIDDRADESGDLASLIAVEEHRIAEVKSENAGKPAGRLHAPTSDCLERTLSDALRSGPARDRRLRRATMTFWDRTSSS